MVTCSDKALYLDGKPIFLLSGECHYFRQPRSNWQHLLDEAKEMGLNCIAAYVPWLLHEEKEGEFDFSGHLDLGAFIDLCQENGLYVFIRPGPFIMAEMKNEGIPYWVGEKYPEIYSVGFRGETRKCNTVDYLHEGYLSCCRRWYEEVMKIIVPRLQPNGGNIIGVQLDNEIGMLNWVTNFPTLNDRVLVRFGHWLKETYGESLKERYPFDPEAEPAKLRDPKPQWEIAFHFDYSRFMRDYYAEYVAVLRQYAIDCGVKDVPFFINVHGTGDARIYDLPLGISQLYKSYNQSPDILSGTDLYLGEPTEGNYQDTYVCNVFTDAMNGPRPLTVIEFGSSDGPYCSFNGMRIHPTAPAHQTLLCLSQNARMLNYYLFSGGENYELKYPRNDGDDRMGFTGQLHGMNCPIQPDGTRNYAFGPLSRAGRAIHALAPLAASARQQCDDLVMAYLPDYFLTEACDPQSEAVQKLQQNLRALRCAGAIDGVARGILGTGCRFSGMEVNQALQQRDKAVFLLSARYMAEDTQKKILEFVKEGGRLLLYGELPEFDLEGAPCSLLRTGLGLSEPVYEVTQNPGHFVLFHGMGDLRDVLPDIRGSRAQSFVQNGSQWLSTRGNPDRMCAFAQNFGKGKLAAVTCDYPGYPDFWKQMLGFLEVAPAVFHNEKRGGVYISRSLTEDGQGYFVVLNLDSHEKTVDITVDGEVLYRDLFLTEKRAMILPYHVKLACGEVVFSTAELLGEEPNALHLGLTQKSDVIVLKTGRKVLPQAGITVTQDGECTVIRVEKDCRTTPEIVLNLE